MLPTTDGSWRWRRSPVGPKSRGKPGRGALSRLATRFLAWKAQRETVRLLNAVDAATLRDLGITDIESQVYGDPSDRMRGYDRNWWRRRSARRVTRSPPPAARPRS